MRAWMCERFVDRTAIFSPCDREGRCALEQLLLVHARLLANQLELVIVADHQARARNAVAKLVAGQPRALLARVEDE